MNRKVPQISPDPGNLVIFNLDIVFYNRRKLVLQFRMLIYRVGCGGRWNLHLEGKIERRNAKWRTPLPANIQIPKFKTIRCYFITWWQLANWYLTPRLSEGTQESHLSRVISRGYFTANNFQNVTNVKYRSLALIFNSKFGHKLYSSVKIT